MQWNKKQQVRENGITEAKNTQVTKIVIVKSNKMWHHYI